MMADITVFFDGETMSSDVSFSNGDLVMGNDLETAVFISLFTWARVDGQKGWWGDSYSANEGHITGSKIWTVFREKITSETLARIQQYAKECLAWLIEDKVAQKVLCVCERNTSSIYRVDLRVFITLMDGSIESFQFGMSNTNG